MTESEQPGAGVLPKTIEFHYIKSNAFRVVHVDGGYGGIAARGYITLALFNERRPIPRVTRIGLDESGKTVLPEQIIETRRDVVREVEVNLIMDERTAAEIRDWLTTRIAELQKIKEGTRE